MKVRDIVEIVLELNGTREIENTCDLLIEGDWEQEVTGVVTTFMATVDVIRRATGMGCNLVITHEPTYFTHADSLDWLTDDPVYHRKKALIEVIRRASVLGLQGTPRAFSIQSRKFINPWVEMAPSV